MGVWLVSDGIRMLVSSMSLYLISPGSRYQSVFGSGYLFPAMTAAVKANTIAALVTAFIGFSLLLGRKRLAEVISAMRGRQSLSE